MEGVLVEGSGPLLLKNTNAMSAHKNVTDFGIAVIVISLLIFVVKVAYSLISLLIN